MTKQFTKTFAAFLPGRHCSKTTMRDIVRRLAASLLLLGATLTVAPAEAGLFFGNIAKSTDATGSTYEGELLYAFTSSTEATLTIDLTNLTPTAVGGFMTAFVFNVPDAVTGVTLSSASPATMNTFFFSPDNINAQPFGQDFDVGVGVGGNVNSVFEGGGNPSVGIPIGGGGTFVFDLTGTGLDLLTQQSFLETPNGGPFFVGRFRGLANGGSDKVPATSTPEPSSLALIVLGGLAGLAGAARRRPLSPALPSDMSRTDCGEVKGQTEISDRLCISRVRAE